MTNSADDQTTRGRLKMADTASLGHLTGATILITGGTRGIGLATGLAFGRQGARCVLTHRWGSADEGEIISAFREAGAPEPIILEANVADDGDTTALMEKLRETTDRIDVFVSNAAFASPVHSIDDYVKRDFLRAIEYSTWPIVSYTQKIHSVFGAYPRYIIGLSSPGHYKHLDGYDAVAMAKAMLETLCRYLAHRLRPHGVNVNVVRAGFVDTDALASVIGMEKVAWLRRTAPEQIIPSHEVANAVIALCSGLLDGVNGHVLQVDRGTMFSDSILKSFNQQTEKET